MAETTRVSVGCDFAFEVPAPVAAVFQVEPQSGPGQKVVKEELTLQPRDGEHTSYDDSFGNRCSRLLIPAGDFRLRYDAVFEVPRAPVSYTHLTLPTTPYV